MMMKIFGAVLIISGGFLFGRGISEKWNRRLTAVNDLLTLFSAFDTKLRESRLSPDEFFAAQGEIGAHILNRIPIKGLSEEDQAQLEQHLECLRRNSFRESVAANEEYLKYLNTTVEKLKNDSDSSGRAIPLVSGAAGFLIVVMLF